MKSLINWEELKKITRPSFPHLNSDEWLNLWNNESVFYDRIITMEDQGTKNAIHCMPIQSDDTVLDVGCGPGRITSQLAKIARKVTALDVSEKMMEKCKEKIIEYTNVETVLMDWHSAEPDVNLSKHDIVIASRSIAGEDIKKLSSFAKKYVILTGWANAPSIPEIRGAIFTNAHKEGSSVHPIPFSHDRRVQYNLQYNMVYDLGYEPNIRIVEDGFERYYSTKEEAYSDILLLVANPDELDVDIFRKNVDRYLTFSHEHGYRFFIETRTFVMWWETDPKNLYKQTEL